MSPENAARGGGSQTLHNFTVAVVGDAVLDPDDARNYYRRANIVFDYLRCTWGLVAVQLFRWKSEVGVIAYRRQGKGGFGLPVPAYSSNFHARPVQARSIPCISHIRGHFRGSGRTGKRATFLPRPGSI
jgi:hypothetical protein